YADFDLLVRRADRPRAFAALAQLGFASEMSRNALRTIYGTAGAWPLYRPNSCGVDLHWRLAAQRFPLPVRTEDVFAESTTVDLAGRCVRALSSAHNTALL